MKGLQPYLPALKSYLASGRPFMGICVGLQSLYATSEENDQVPGLAIFDQASVQRFNNQHKTVPHMGWNDLDFPASKLEEAELLGLRTKEKYYFVHSFAVLQASSSSSSPHVLAITTYEDESFVSAVKRENIFATQFHPEKSGWAGLLVLNAFITNTPTLPVHIARPLSLRTNSVKGLTKRIIVCLDVRLNDEGRLVVTKGDQYDVREGQSKQVRNLGDPVEMAEWYFQQGADEICFLNITSFRQFPLADLQMLMLLKRASERIFVPLTVGGGIRDWTDQEGVLHTALDVAGTYFKNGADKVSIGSDAVLAAESLLRNISNSSSSIQQISETYGKQAVVISVDPKRVYCDTPLEERGCIPALKPGPNQESLCWYQCTTQGGRKIHDLSVPQLVKACEELGAGEFLVNCIDQDGTGDGFDLSLMQLVKSVARVPVIASSGAGNAHHFVRVFEQTGVEAALAAGIFHRREVSIEEVKLALLEKGLPVRT